MGHLSGKDIYRKLGRKIDGLTMRAPWNDALRSILEELYTADEADVVVRMPYVLSPFDRVQELTGVPAARLKYVLERLCEKGLVVDLHVNGGFHFMPSPLVVGIFEFTMMRTGVNAPLKTVARMFHEYISDSSAFYAANSGGDMRVSVMRSLPHEEAVELSGHVEVLDYEKASAIVMEADRFSLGTCSCRHEKLHAGEKSCDVPLEKCSSFGISAEYLVRHGLARKSSRTEMLENIARSREMGLVLNADNVKKNITFICHCCKCCCNTLLGISRHGYPNTIVTSSLIAHIDREKCRGCGKCVEACPIQGIDMSHAPESPELNRKKAVVDSSICLGCGVCVLQCSRKAVTLNRREQRVLHPETSFERVILQCLERGTLQNQIFDNPSAVTHKVMRGIIGGFLRLPPVKRALMSDALRSNFLRVMERGARLQDKAWVLNI
jgi:ferredoxin